MYHNTGVQDIVGKSVNSLPATTDSETFHHHHHHPKIGKFTAEITAHVSWLAMRKGDSTSMTLGSTRCKFRVDVPG